jgi:tetratricopeptide (TPR) repeat protein
LARALLRHANALVFNEQADAAADALREAQRLRPDAGGGDEQADVHNRLAAIARRQGALGTADSLMRRALGLAVTDSMRATTLNNLGSLLRVQERFAESEPVSREALRLARRTYAPTERSRNVAANNLAGLLVRLGRFPEAIALLEEEVATHRAHFPPDHWRLGSCINSVAIALRQAGRPAEAAERFDEAARIFARGLGPTHEWTQRAERDRDAARAAARSDAPRTDTAGKPRSAPTASRP